MAAPTRLAWVKDTGSASAISAKALFQPSSTGAITARLRRDRLGFNKPPPGGEWEAPSRESRRVKEPDSCDAHVADFRRDRNLVSSDAIVTIHIVAPAQSVGRSCWQWDEPTNRNYWRQIGAARGCACVCRAVQTLPGCMPVDTPCRHRLNMTELMLGSSRSSARWTTTEAAQDTHPCLDRQCPRATAQCHCAGMTYSDQPAE